MDIKKAVDAVKKAGRGGDTQLVHVTSREIAMLKKAGGAGTVNPHTGLMEFMMSGASNDAAGTEGASSRGGSVESGRSGRGSAGNSGAGSGGGGGNGEGGSGLGGNTSNATKTATAGEVIGGVAKGVSTGATIGGLAGPVGSAVGGAIGGVIGGIHAAGIGSFGGFGARAASAAGNKTENDKPRDPRMSYTSGSNKKAQGSSQQSSSGNTETYTQPTRRRGLLGGAGRHYMGAVRPTLLGS